MSEPQFLEGSVRIAYERAGIGPDLVLQHGYSATRKMWQPQRQALESSYRILTFDYRGHGETESPTDLSAYSARHCNEDLLRLLDRHEIERAVVGGLSLGGYLSLDFYRRYPERVSALVLCDCGPGYKSDTARAGWNERAEVTARRFQELGLDALAGRSREMEEARGVHQSADGLRLAALGMLKQFSDEVIQSLPDVRVPTLVIVGDRDEPFLAASSYMAQKIPGASLVTIPDAGHSANLDQPELFNDALRAFLEKHSESIGAGS